MPKARAPWPWFMDTIQLLSRDIWLSYSTITGDKFLKSVNGNPLLSNMECASSHFNTKNTCVYWFDTLFKVAVDHAFAPNVNLINKFCQCTQRGHHRRRAPFSFSRPDSASHQSWHRIKYGLRSWRCILEKGIKSDWVWVVYRTTHLNVSHFRARLSCKSLFVSFCVRDWSPSRTKILSKI